MKWQERFGAIYMTVESQGPEHDLKKDGTDSEVDPVLGEFSFVAHLLTLSFL